MKIKKLLEKTYKKLHYENLHQECEFELKDEAIFETKAISLERRHTLNELNNLFKSCHNGHDEVTFEQLTPFQDFLMRRWERIRGTKLSYPHATRNSLTHLCEMLADELTSSGLFLNCKHKLLMPTLVTMNEVTLCDLNESEAENKPDDQLQLHHFVLSDDDRHIINIIDCLSDSKEDGTLKHTSVLTPNKKAYPLNNEEKQRVINHSEQSSEYYALIQQLYDIKNNGESIGAAVRRLIKQLRLGGQNGGRDGTAFVAGQDALNGIKEFYAFTKTLDREEMEKLYAASSIQNAVASNFEICWYHLLCRAALEKRIEISEEELNNILFCLSSDVNATGQVPCVELLSNDIERILNNYDDLFNIYPKNKESSTRVAVQIAETRIAEARSILFNEMRTKSYEVLSGYGEEGKKRLLKQFYGSLMGTVTDLKQLFINIPATLHHSLLTTILDPEHLRRMIKTTDDLKFILRNLSDSSIHESLFKVLGQHHIQGMIKHTYGLRMMLNTLSPSQYSIFLRDYLGQEHAHKIIKSSQDLHTLLFGFPPTTRDMLITILDIKIQYKSRSKCRSYGMRHPFFKDKNIQLKNETTEKSVELSAQSSQTSSTTAPTPL